MKLLVERADLDRDEAAITAALQAWLNPDCDSSRYDWLYRHSPFGRALTWIARDSDGKMIGVAAAFPRQVFINGSKSDACVLGDFCISSAHRTVGPALALQRACLQGIEGAGLPVWFDFPSRSMLSVHLRLGGGQASEVVRMAKPLRVNSQKIQSMVRSRALSSLLSGPANLLLAATRRQTRAKGIDVELQSDPVGAEFSEFAERLGSTAGKCVFRSAEYLNWRYYRHPIRRYNLFTAREAGRLQGYIVTSKEVGSMLIVDMLADSGRGVMSALLRHAAWYAYSQGSHTISFPVPASSRIRPELKREGFRDREKSPLLVGGEAAGSVNDWLLLHGDRES